MVTQLQVRHQSSAPQYDGRWSLETFFAIAYLTQGISSQFGLIAQPVQFLLMKGLSFSAADVSTVMAILMLPWLLKPFYGLICDNFALFGYHRKSYLIAAHLFSIVALAVLAFVSAPYAILLSLVANAGAMAVATALMLGLAAENGAKNGRTASYVSAQSFYYYLGNIGAVLGAGFLCQTLQPQTALNFAAALAVIPVVFSTALCLTAVREPKATEAPIQSQAETQSVWETLLSKPLWLLAGLAACWNFTPCFGVPLYFHESNNLRFSQELIGQLAAWNAVGMMSGALVYRDVLSRMAPFKRLYITAALWCASILVYSLLAEPISAYPIELFRGVCNTLEILCLYELGAAYCCRTNAVTVMALLLAARNIAHEFATLIGGNLFTHIFGNTFGPMVICGVLLPLASFALIPHIVAAQNRRRLHCQ